MPAEPITYRNAAQIHRRLICPLTRGGWSSRSGKGMVRQRGGKEAVTGGDPTWETDVLRWGRSRKASGQPESRRVSDNTLMRQAREKLWRQTRNSGRAHLPGLLLLRRGSAPPQWGLWVWPEVRPGRPGRPGRAPPSPPPPPTASCLPPPPSSRPTASPPPAPAPFYVGAPAQPTKMTKRNKVPYLEWSQAKKDAHRQRKRILAGNCKKDFKGTPTTARGCGRRQLAARCRPLTTNRDRRLD